MAAYEIADMTCGGCVRAIRAAVARVAPAATVHADVATRRVSIDGPADAAAVAAAIASAGFAVRPLEAVPTAVPRTAGGCGGGRCGCAGNPGAARHSATA